MISWKIWHILRNPPFRHPLFRRVLANRPVQSSAAIDVYSLRSINVRGIMEPLIALLFCAAMCSPILLIVACIGLLFILNGTGYSVWWAVKSSGIIAQERAHGTYDLYCVSPEGALGVNWALCTGFLHRSRQLGNLHSLVRSVLMIILAIVGIMALVVISTTVKTQDDLFVREGVDRSWIMLINIVAVIAVIYIDHIHSIVLGIVVSILVPTYARGRIDAQLGTFGVFMLLQVMTYLLSWFVALVLLPAIFRGVDSWIAQAILALLQVASFYAIRESMIQLLWHQLAQRLDITSGEAVSIAMPTFQPGFKPEL